jgi:hypothetical protein
MANDDLQIGVKRDKSGQVAKLLGLLGDLGGRGLVKKSCSDLGGPTAQMLKPLLQLLWISCDS